MKHIGKIALALFAVCFFGSNAAFADATMAKSDGFTDTFKTLDTNRWYVADGYANGDHQSCECRADAFTVTDKSLLMSVSERGGKIRPIGCPSMHTKKLLGYGRYEVRMRTAAGSGLNTNFFTYIGPGVGVSEWDEIDFEFLGKDPTKVEINHTTRNNKIIGKIVDMGFDSSKDFHDYAFEWSKDKIVWYIDGKEVHRTPPGTLIPNKPTSLYLSLWSGAQAMDSWMGKFSYTKPMTAEVMSVSYTPF